MRALHNEWVKAVHAVSGINHRVSKGDKRDHLKMTAETVTDIDLMPAKDHSLR